jgi:hypothetical protein
MRSFLKQAIYTRNCGEPICRAKIPQRRWCDDKAISKTFVVLGLTEEASYPLFSCIPCQLIL